MKRARFKLKLAVRVSFISNCSVCQDSVKKRAVLDTSGLYRYSLWREWDEKAPLVTFIMLNPSRADATFDDPTLRQCISLASFWGFGSLEVVNLFAYRTPHPALLRQISDPVGADNDRYIQLAAQRAQAIILAWGNQGTLANRNQTVLGQLASFKNLHCLGITHKGHPRHPLYLSRHVPLSPYPT